MPIARRKAGSPARSRGRARDPDTDTDYEPGTEDTDAPPPPPSVGHSKGENRGGKMRKRLTYGTMLLVFLCCIIAAGHLWTLLLVRRHALPAVRRAALIFVAPSSRALRCSRCRWPSSASW